MVSLTALALLALPLAVTASSAGAPHYSHPRRSNNALTATGAHARAAVRYRALPRSGRRLSKRGGGGAGTEATLKCLTAHTFALCDGDRCTDMGAVAAGTACIDGAITWDTTSEASSEDSSAATVSYAVEVPSSSAAAVVVEPSSADAAPAADAEETLSAAQPLANNVAVQTSSAAAPAATASAVDSVQLNVGSSSSDDDDEWECDSDDVSSSSTAWTPAASSSSTAADNVQLNAKPTTTTTTTQAPAQTSAAASSGGGTTYTGRGTYYYQGGAAGSCGNYASDSDYVVALSYTQVDGGAHCGQKVQLTNTQNGKTVVATVADTCPGCAYGAIDLSEGYVCSFSSFCKRPSSAPFLQLGTLDQGVLPLSWKYVS
ncbi:hypothetical protein JCM9279_004947 [Rhodotorula babjevae]